MTTLRAHDRGFSLIEAMVASIVMLIGLLGLAGLQVVGMRANNLGKRMSQAALLAQDLSQNMQIWAYSDSRFTPQNNTGTFTDTNAAAIAKYWSMTNTQHPKSTVDGSALVFDYSDAATATGDETVSNALATYQGVQSPVDPTLPAGEQVIFTRFWNVFNMDLGMGSPQGKLIQIVVRWKEPNFGYRSVVESFFKYDPTEFNQ